jgi:hypothetical protein
MSLKTITLFFAAMLVPAATVAQVIPSEVDWIRQFGGEGPSNDELNAVAVDGGIYVAGNSSGSLPDDTAVFGVFLRRYDANGAVAWTRQFGTSGTQAVLGVAAAADAVYVVGVTRDPIDGQATFGDSDGFVCRFTAEGDQRWCRIVGTPEFDDTASAVADATGVYIAGYTWGTLAGQTKNGAFTDAYIQKYDTDGNTVWTRQFGSSDVTRAEAIAADGVALYVAGAVRGSLGGQAPAGATDVFVRSYDMSGNELWTRQFGSSESDSAARIAVSAGRVYVAAVTFGALPGQVSLGATDVFVRAYDSSGLELWTRQFGTETSDAIGGVAADWAGVYAAGSTFGTLPGRTSIGMQDAFLRRYDASGNEL